MGASYAREKLGAAVYTLATGTEVLQKRLVDAFISMSAVSERDFKDDRRTEWRSIYERATAVESGPYDGRYQNTLLTLNDGDAVQLARDICELEAMMSFEDEG